MTEDFRHIGRSPGAAARTRHSFVLHQEFIELHALLKLLALAPSGGAAKALIAAGAVSVDGRTETRKACKIRAGQVVQVGDDAVSVSSLSWRAD